MRKFLASTGLLGLIISGDAAFACSGPVPYLLDNQTVTAQMTVKTGRPCGYGVGASDGPTHGHSVVQRPSHGTVTVSAAGRIIYKSRPSYVGRDTFTYARRGLGPNGNPVVRTVKVDVTVTP